MYRRFLLVLAALAACQLAAPARTHAAPAPAPRAEGTAFAYFPETGHNIGLAVKRFYDTHGVDILACRSPRHRRDGQQAGISSALRAAPELPPSSMCRSRCWAATTPRAAPSRPFSGCRPTPAATARFSAKAGTRWVGRFAASGRGAAAWQRSATRSRRNLARSVRRMGSSMSFSTSSARASSCTPSMSARPMR